MRRLDDYQIMFCALTNNVIVLIDLEGIMPLPKGHSMPPMPVAGRLCTPILGPKWIDAHEDTLIDGVPSLTSDCTIACVYQGIIFFLDDGQMSD